MPSRSRGTSDPRRRWRRAGLVCAIAFSIESPEARADLASDFAREALYENVIVSPSGKYLAVVFRDGGEEFVATLDRATLKPRAKIPMGERRSVADLVWAKDERLLIWPAERFPTIDFKAPTGEIVGINADGTRVATLYGRRAGRASAKKFGAAEPIATNIRAAEPIDGWATLVDLLPDVPDYVMIASHRFGDRGRSTVAAKLNVRDGRLVPDTTSPAVDGEFVCGPDGDVALTFGMTPDGQYVLFKRLAVGNDFKEVMTRRADQGRVIPIKAYDETRFLVVDDVESATRGISLWDKHTKEREPLFHHDRVDIDDVWFDGSTTRLYALRYVDHVPKYFYPDDQHPLARAHQSLRRAFPDDDVTFTSVTRANDFAVALVEGDHNPGAFYLVDVHAGTASKISDSRPWLARERLSTVRPIELVVRDKTTVSGYLTIPNDYRAPGPMVVMIHGGPYGVRDTWGFDAESELLAAAGYAVLRVNYRGSGGFGRLFESAGYRQWGRAMQDDVTDATRWALAEQIADPKRICIFGGSYGAYAALTGAFEEPDLYRCAIGYSGVYDLPLLFESGEIAKRRWGESYLKEAIGDDADALKALSPVYNAERIKAAVMLVHGRRDERAPFEHAKRMRAALEQAGKAPEWMVESGEGHGFFDPANRAELYRQVLAFLDRNIGTSAVKPD